MNYSLINSNCSVKREKDRLICTPIDSMSGITLSDSRMAAVFYLYNQLLEDEKAERRRIERDKEYSRVTVKDIYDRRKNAHCCVSCGNPLSKWNTSVRCDPCRLKRNEYARMWYKDKKAREHENIKEYT